MAKSRVDLPAILRIALQAGEQEGPRRPSAWGELAQDSKALSFNAYGKGSGCARKVHVLIRGDPDTARRSGNGAKRSRAARSRGNGAKRNGNSAEGIVVKRRGVCPGHGEGPNNEVREDLGQPGRKRRLRKEEPIPAA